MLKGVGELVFLPWLNKDTLPDSQLVLLPFSVNDLTLSRYHSDYMFEIMRVVKVGKPQS